MEGLVKLLSCIKLAKCCSCQNCLGPLHLESFLLGQQYRNCQVHSENGKLHLPGLLRLPHATGRELLSCGPLSRCLNPQRSYHWPSLLLYRIPTNLAAKLFKWPACSSIGHNPNRCVNSRGTQGSGCSGRVSASLPSSKGVSLMCTPLSLFELVSPCFFLLCCENHCDWLHWPHHDIQTILLWIANTLIPYFSLPPKPRHSQLLRTWMFTSWGATIVPKMNH